MGAKVYLTYIIILEDCWISCIGSVVGGTVIDGTASREGQSSFQPILIYHLRDVASSFSLHMGEKEEQEQ